MNQMKYVSPQKPVISKKFKSHVKWEGKEMNWKCVILKIK